MKFKVGDKVRIREDLVVGRTYGGITNYSFLSETDGHLGVQTITHITNSGNYRLNKATFIYSEEMLKPVEESESEKLVIYRNGNKTIAKYYKGDKVVTASATCCSCDNYDFKNGVTLTTESVFNKMEEEEVGYSQVKCVGYRTTDNFNFTIDKKYKIYDNGRIIDDSGFVFRNTKTKKDMLDFLSEFFIFEEVDKQKNPS